MGTISTLSQLKYTAFQNLAGNVRFALTIFNTYFLFPHNLYKLCTFC